MIHKKILEDEKTRAQYFHDLAENSRALELLLNTSYNFGMVPVNLNLDNKKSEKIYIVFEFEKNNLQIVGALIDLVGEIKSCEYNIKYDRDGYRIKLSCNKDESEELFIRTKEIIEEYSYGNKQTYNYKIVISIYNIAKIVKEVIDAEMLFALDKKLYDQGKCYLSIYKEKQTSKLNIKKANNINEVLEKLKRSVLHMPTVLLCSFEELRTFYFELDEIAYSKDIEGD